MCTAGITEKGEWIRLYPIRFRHLDDEQKYPLFSWVEVDVKKNTHDIRPESYRIDVDSLTVVRKLDSRKNFEEKRNLILPLLEPSLEALHEKYEKSKISLGIIKPRLIDDLIIEKTDKDWTPAQKAKLCQESFFDKPDQIRLLEKIPYEFSFKFRCENKLCKSHKMLITSWEINQTYRKFLKHYQTETIALQKLKDKYLSFFSADYDGYFFVGTRYPYPSFIIIGHYSYPLKYLKNINQNYKQLSIFDISIESKRFNTFSLEFFFK